MKINFKKEDFDEIESCFNDILESKGNSKSLCEKIEHVLKQALSQNMNIEILKANPSDTFFVMSIYPEQSTLDKMVNAIVSSEKDVVIKKIWEENNDWIIEIDSRIFDDKIHATPRELTALLMHEIGHLVYSNSVPQRVSKVMKYEFAKLAVGTKHVLQNKVFGSVLKLPIINACSHETYKTHDNIRKELKADIFASKMGYGQEVESILQKFTSSDFNKNDKYSGSSEKVYDDEMKNATLFSIDIINNFEKRKSAIAKKNLTDMLVKIPSTYAKNTVNSISSLLFSPRNPMTEKDRMEYVEESVNEIVDDAYFTEFFDFRIKRFKRIDPRKIDYIDVQRGNIKNNDDKMILLNYIYTNLDKINYYLAILDNPDYAKKYRIEDSKEQLISYKNRLLKDRDIVIAYKIPETRYGLEISYPAGYEG